MGDMDLAKRLIISAAECGADICKFQTWSEDKLKSGSWDQDGRREIYKKAQLSWVFLKKLLFGEKITKKATL